jgi:uncharacterized membrane protein YkoI
MMSNRHDILRRLFLIIILSGLTPIAIADDDYIEARHLLDSGKILPLETILKKIRQRFPGKVLDVDLEKEDQKIIYEIEILNSNGMVNKIYIDATTGQLLSVQEDD